MKKLALVTFVFMLAVALIMIACATVVTAQTTAPTTWPVCKLGAAPIAPGPAPVEAKVFKTKGGPVIMSEAGPQGAVRLIRCNLAPVEVYRGADGDLRDLPSNQPFWPVGWDAVPPTPLANAIKGLKGDTGSQGPQGLTGPVGPQGPQGKDAPVIRHGHKKWWVITGILVAGGIGSAIVMAHNREKGGSEAVAIATATINIK